MNAPGGFPTLLKAERKVNCLAGHIEGISGISVPSNNAVQVMTGMLDK